MDRIGPGTLLAGRYRLQEQVQADPVMGLWRAEDLTLERPVAVRILSAEHARVQTTLDAARRAALVDDPRLQRVFGVGVETGIGYVVLEWITGQDAAALAGKVSEPEARRLVVGAAESLRTAASRQLHHGRLGPRQVVRASDGRVRVVGTAIDVAAAGQATPAAAARAESRDVRDLCAVLYALLTGLWPFGVTEGLAAAPTEKGRPVGPRTLRGDVSQPLDALLGEVLAGTGPETLDGLLRRLQGTDAGDGPAQAGPAGAAGAASSRGVTASTAGAGPSRTAEPAHRLIAAQLAAAGSVAAGALGAAAGAVTGRAGAAPQATAPTRYVPSRAPAWRDEDDGWDLLPVRDQPWDEQEWEAADPGAGARQPWDDGTWDDGTWDDGPRDDGPRDDGPRDDGPRQDPAGRDDRGASEALLPASSAGRGARRRTTAGAGTGVAVVLVMGAFVVGGLVWALDRFQNGEDIAAPAPPVVTETVQPSAAPSVAPPPAPPVDEPQLVSPAGVQALDPQGDGEENDQDAPRAIDGDPASSWQTQGYSSRDFGRLKTGLGLAFDLGAPADVGAVTVTAPGVGGSYEIRAATGPGFDGSTVIATGQTGDAPNVLVPETPVTTQFLVVWFTALPEVEGDWRGTVSEVQVQVP